MNGSLMLQRAMVAALSGVAPVFDAAPVDAAPPYLVIGPDVVTEAGSKTETSHDHRVTFSVWTHGPSVAPAKALLAEVEAALAGLAGGADGQRIVFARLVRSLVVPDPEGWVQGVIEFRVRTASE